MYVTERSRRSPSSAPVFRPFRHRGAVTEPTAVPQWTALRRNRPTAVNTFEHPPPPVHAQRSKAFTEKCRFTASCSILACSRSTSLSLAALNASPPRKRCLRSHQSSGVSTMRSSHGAHCACAARVRPPRIASSDAPPAPAAGIDKAQNAGSADYEAALAGSVITWTRQCHRYGEPPMTTLLRDAGREGYHNNPEPISRRPGLKVTHPQPDPEAVDKPLAFLLRPKFAYQRALLRPRRHSPAGMGRAADFGLSPKFLPATTRALGRFDAHCWA